MVVKLKNKDNIKEVVRIVFDENMVDKYNQLYFSKYPQRSKKYITSPVPPSLNKWGTMRRHQANNLKQHWRDFVEWVIKQHGLGNKQIENCSLTYLYFFKTKHKKDLDNYQGKFIADGLVSSGLLKDDNCELVNPVILKFGGYDKHNPRMEIIIEVRKDGIEQLEV